MKIKQYCLYKYEEANLWLTRHLFLVQYAEFLEKEKHDVVTADSLYSKVLKRDPTNAAALLRHQINLPQVKAIDMKHYKAIEAKKYALSLIAPSNLAFRRAKREFYFKLIYHNNAIEGMIDYVT